MFQILPGNKNFIFRSDILSKRGFIFIEILIAIFLTIVAFVALLGVSFSALGVSQSVRQTTDKQALITGEMEALRAWRDSTTWGTNGIGTLSTSPSSPYYFSLDQTTNPPQWKSNSGAETTGGITRKIVFARVSRDLATGNIQSTYNASYDDSDTRKVTVTVTDGSKTIQVVTYLTNWKK